MCQLKLFGQPQIYVSGKKINTRSKRVFVILALVRAYQSPMKRIELQKFLWSSLDIASQEVYANRLRVLLYNMRSYRDHFLEIGDELVFKGQEYTDVDQFDALSIESSTSNRKKAIDLYVGEFMEGFELSSSPIEFDNWLEFQRSTYKTKILATLDALTSDLAKSERSSNQFEMLHYLRKSESIDPWRDELQIQIASVYVKQRQIIKAIQSLENYLQRLKKSLELDASDEVYTLLKHLKELHPT